MNTDDLPALDVVETLVRETAHAELLPRFAMASSERKADGSLVTEADVAVQRRLQDTLASQWPDYGFLGEEMDADEQRALLAEPGRALWCLDPLDGTSNFIVGVPFFATSLALLVGGEVRLGLVYDPIRGECFMADKGRGAWLNETRLGGGAPRTPLRQGVALVDFKRLAPGLAQRLVAEPPYSSQRSFGCVALDWCWIAAGRGHVYLHGKQSLWDYAAGALILDEAGGHSTTLNGEAVFRPELTPRTAVAALDAGLFRQWCRWLGVPENRDER